MKRIISLLLVAALLMSVCCITAFAEDKKPLNGPWSSISFSGGARLFFSNLNEAEANYVVENKGDGLAINNDAMAGATYDLESNTLTISDLSAEDYSLVIWYMGDDFKLCVEGSCSLAVISVHNYGEFYSTSLNITGTGTLTVNEKKAVPSAIMMFSDLENNASCLNIASTVSVNLYASQQGEETARVAAFYSSGYDTADKAFSAGGKAIEGCKSERVAEMEYDTVKAAIHRNHGIETSYGYSCLSKTDDGVYAANEQFDDGNELIGYYVTKLIKVEEFDTYMVDHSFGEYGGMAYSVDEFNENYELDTIDAPKEILFTSEYNEEYGKGYNGVKLIKNDDPDGVYVGSPSGFEEPYSYDDPESYFIYRVTWDEAQGFYVEDTGFEAVSVNVDELEANGYKVVTEQAEQNKQFFFWGNPAPYDDANEYESKDQMKKADDPDGIYVKTFPYESTVEGEVVDSGVYVNKLVYDAENDAYYRNPDADFEVSYSDFETDGWSFVTETVDKKIELKYITDDYGFEDYAFHAHELSRKDERGAVYAYTTWSYEDEVYYHDIYKLTMNEADGHYYCESDEYGTHPLYEELTDEQITEAGFTIEYDPEPFRLIMDGEVICGEYDVYLDAGSETKYICYYDDTIYRIDESKTVQNGSQDYFFAYECHDVEQSALHQEPHEVQYNLWSYWLDGDEYHYQGSGHVPSDGFTVKGTVTSYVSDADVIVELVDGDEEQTPVCVLSGGKTDFEFVNVAPGEYTLRVGKKDHVTHECPITVKNADVTENVKICPRGDVNNDGETDILDCSLAQRYIRELTELDPYQIACGDVSGEGDGELDIQDVSRILRHIRELALLY